MTYAPHFVAQGRVLPEALIQSAARDALQYLVDSVLGFLQHSLREQ